MVLPGLIAQCNHRRTPVMAMVGTLHQAEPTTRRIGAEVLATWTVSQGGARPVGLLDVGVSTSPAGAEAVSDGE